MTRSKWIAAVLCLVLLAGLVPGAAAEQSVGGTDDPTHVVLAYETDILVERMLAYEMQLADVEGLQALIDGRLVERAGIDAEWYAIAISQYDGTLTLDAYADALEGYLAEKCVLSAATRQKYALALVACGRENTAFVRDTMNDSIGELGIMSLVFGLHLLHNGLTSPSYTPDAAIDALLALQLEDGGFAVSGKSANADVTAMTLQALAPYTDDAKVAAAVTRAIDRLSDLQKEDGSFESYGVCNAESCAQVLMALCALGLDPYTDARFIQNGNTVVSALERFRTPEGGYCHEMGDTAQVSATAQTLCAYVALWRMQNGQGFIYRFDHVNYDPATIPTVTPEQETSEKLPARVIVAIALGAVALIAAAVVLAVKKKRGVKDAILIVLAAVLAVALVLTVRVQTPDEYYGESGDVGEPVGTVTLEIRCDTVAGMADHIPSDGVILERCELALYEGDSAYDVLKRAAREHRLLLDAVGGESSSVYISGIEHLHEFDFGDRSGWIYTVNGVRPSHGCAAEHPRPGDAIGFYYTRELGEDAFGEVMP